jgi:hypothetical protein
MRKAPFAAVRDEHPWRDELPKEESPGPYEADSDDGVRGRSVARASAYHLNDVSSSNIEIGENIRENSKLPPLLEVMVSHRRVDFQKISSEAMVDLRGWRSL